MMEPRAIAPSPIISLEGVSFSYEGGSEALRGVCLDIREGEYAALVGGNGSGKTTLAKHLNGLLKPSSGVVTVGGVDTRKTSTATLARTVGYVFQNPDHQLFCTSVEDEVRFGPRNMGFGEERTIALVNRAVALTGIGDILTQSPVTLTLGDRRKVTIASVLATAPRVLVFDEPTTGLDSVESKQLMETLDALRSEGIAILLITHEMRLVSQHVDRVIVMSEGAIVADASTDDAFSDPEMLRRCHLIAPPVTVLAQRLRSKRLMASTASTPSQLADRLSFVGGSGR
ncbi:TPA: ATP-binding cassette domain-containing protein [Thermoplasmata archaeon]|nr:ATP-binding cassette domain-containing protein [Thermoplasmata archaeon]